eukprot:6212081-Pleurochrysis_carterae.AAC.2
MLSVQIMWAGDIAVVGRVLQYVVAAGRMCRAEEQAGATDEFVRAVKLGAVAAGHAGRRPRQWRTGSGAKPRRWNKLEKRRRPCRRPQHRPPGAAGKRCHPGRCVKDHLRARRQSRCNRWRRRRRV